MPQKIKSHPSVLKGEGKFHLDERTKKAFTEIIKKSKKEKFDPRKHNQTIICGEAEFAESQKLKKTKK